MSLDGCPSKYDPKYCEEIINFFDVEPYKTVKGKAVPCKLPTFNQFARKIGISNSTLFKWRKTYKEFGVACNDAKALQRDIMVINGVAGLYNPGFLGLSMKNMHGWSDKQEIDNTHNVNMMPPVKITDGNGEPRELDFEVGDLLEKPKEE